jgi:hypothetical protein
LLPFTRNCLRDIPVYIPANLSYDDTKMGDRDGTLE